MKQVQWIILRDGIAWGPFDTKAEARIFIEEDPDNFKGARVATLLNPSLASK